MLHLLGIFCMSAILSCSDRGFCLASSANVRIIFLIDQYEMWSLGLSVEQNM